MAKFRDMQEQGTFHAGRQYERDILSKRIKELEAKNKRYCPKCDEYVLLSEVKDLFHTVCHCRTVPKWSEERRGRLRAEERIKDLEKAIEEWRNKADSELDINAGLHTENALLQKRIKKLEALRDTVSISCHSPDDCNDPKVLKTYMKGCFDEARKLY